MEGVWGGQDGGGGERRGRFCGHSVGYGFVSVRGRVEEERGGGAEGCGCGGGTLAGGFGSDGDGGRGEGGGERGQAQ